MEGNKIKIITIGCLTASFLLWGCPEFLHQNRWYTPLVYHIYHANIFHLAVNCLSIWAIFRKGATYKATPLLIAFIIASISWFFTIKDVVGISNIIFALIGLRTPPLKHSWWRSRPVVTFLVVTGLMALFPQVSAITHIVSFVLGCLVAGVQRTINNLSRDYSRATYR